MSNEFAFEVDSLRIGEANLPQFDIISVSADPNISGHSAPLSTLAMNPTTGILYTKIGVLDTDWSVGEIPGTPGGGGGSGSFDVLLNSGLSCSVAVLSGSFSVLLNSGLSCSVAVL